MYEFLDVEAALVAVVKSLVRVSASTQVPNPVPAEHVQVTRVGGTADGFTDEPMVQFVVRAAGWPAAASLAALTRRRVTSVSRFGDVPVYRCREIAGLSRSPDPVSGDPRYLFTVAYKLRGQEASD